VTLERFSPLKAAYSLAFSVGGLAQAKKKAKNTEVKQVKQNSVCDYSPSKVD